LITIEGVGFQPGPGFSVTFDGQLAPLLYADTGQVNAIVPFAVGSKASTTSFVVTNAGQTLGPYQLTVFPAMPGVFAYDKDVTWETAALNQDGSVNSPTNPAGAGSVVTI
jgi:uncharacterized protein (TIGR03437 family)